MHGFLLGAYDSGSYRILLGDGDVGETCLK